MHAHRTRANPAAGVRGGDELPLTRVRKWGVGGAWSSILYQRGVYPAETFERKKKYGLTMLVSSDTGLTDYLSNVFQQISGATLYLCSLTRPGARWKSPLEFLFKASRRRGYSSSVWGCSERQPVKCQAEPGNPAGRPLSPSASRRKAASWSEPTGAAEYKQVAKV